MSAIFGISHLNAQPVAASDLEAMRVTLAPYGQIAGGIWSQAHIGLGVCLSHITPQDAFEQQPLIGRDQQVVLIADARLDNRPELARELELADMRTLPDSALILRAYEKWQTNSAMHLIGDFVFVVWDARDQKLFIARSPFSSRALFYHITPHTFAFASMPKGLHALAHIPRSLDEEHLADYLTMNSTAPDQTFYRDIQRLLPGQSLTIQDGSLQIQTYWQLDLQREIRFAHDDDYLAAFNEVFERAISDALVSTSQVGIMVSGGLDSSSIASIAATQLADRGQHLIGFTEVPPANFDGALIPGRYADETPFVQALSRRYENLDLNLVRADGRSYLQDTAAFFQACELPFRNVSNRVWWEEILRQAQAQNIGVLLNGGQGNLTISWRGDGLLPQLIRAGHFSRVWREARGLAQHAETPSTLRGLITYGLMPLLPDRVYLALKRLRGKQQLSNADWRAYSAINPDFYRAQRVAERAQANESKTDFRGRGDMRSTRAQTLIGTSAAADGFGAGYQALFGVEQRAPAADQRVVEFCFALPEDQFLRNGQTRWLIQRTMAQRLPPEILNNKKRGLQAANWYERLVENRADLLTEIARLEKSELAARILDVQRLRGLVEQMPDRVADPGRAAMDYRFILEIGLMTGRFVRWVETGE